MYQTRKIGFAELENVNDHGRWGPEIGNGANLKSKEEWGRATDCSINRQKIYIYTYIYILYINARSQNEKLIGSSRGYYISLMNCEIVVRGR